MKKPYYPTVITNCTLALFFILSIFTVVHISYQNVYAEELWQLEFSTICSKTNDAMTFSRDELKTLLERGEKLKHIIETFEETPRKVYLKRLEKCMKLYEFVLEAKGFQNDKNLK